VFIPDIRGQEEEKITFEVEGEEGGSKLNMWLRVEHGQPSSQEFDVFNSDIRCQDDDKMCVVVEGEEGGEGGSKKKLRQANGPSEKSALFYAYNHQVHEFVGHLRRVHPSLPVQSMAVTHMGKTSNLDVKAADPLADPGTPLYYYHSKTPYYNDIFFTWWDECFAFTFRNTCPVLAVNSPKRLRELLDLELDRCVHAVSCVNSNQHALILFWTARRAGSSKLFHPAFCTLQIGPSIWARSPIRGIWTPGQT